MTRFMMSLAESVDLVLYALANGKDGEMYVRKAPAATVGVLAEAMISLFGYKGGIEEIGTRPGEKMHETLISTEEAARSEDCGKYFKIDPEVPGMDMKKYYFEGKAKSGISLKDGYTSANTEQLSVEETKKLLLTLPEIKEALKELSR